MPVYWIWFAELKNISLWAKQQLLTQFRDPEELYLADEKALKELPAEVVEALQDKDLTAAWQIHNQCQQKGIQILLLSAYLLIAEVRRLRRATDGTPLKHS